MKSIVTICLFVSTNILAGEISDRYESSVTNRYREVDASRSYEEIEANDHGISEIGIERTRCYGTCPAYSVIINQDGTFKYTGYFHVDRMGIFSGTVSKWELRNLFSFIKDVDIESMQDRYFIPVTDSPTTYTLVTINGRTKIISNYANSGPTTLWAIEELIDKLILKANWDDTEVTE